ncbi:dihydroorotase [Tepidibacter formicigenes]|jgi:dihydroorotase|uniref:Dihydroorotase n=1 Tax=Tepidibacter formicigenes DSM 15518 TaxID=1123349 RepID=A0A1M6PTF5_9FIRM|nr:dihydroorotase [Tepidibacter formicigenes]SHK11170.1 dihydroorotase [Tepidibacter formicigenes DSM 15518]
MDLLIKNVKIVDAKKSVYGDVLIKDGIIKEVNIDINENCQTIDGEGYTLLPSFIDMHTHLRDPGYTYKEDLETGQRAAIKGGYTTLCAMANTNPVCDNKEIIEYVINKSKKLNLCDVIQISSLTKNLDGNEIVDIDEMIKYTNLFSDDGKTVFDENIMKEALKLSQKYNFKILTHCDPEVDIVKSDLNLLESIGGNLHICHISLKETLRLIEEFKNKNVRFTCEVTPHHIFSYDLDYRVNPSIASIQDVNALIQGIKDGYIDVIGTDHAPHSKEDKTKGSPGISLIEVAFSMIYKVFKEKNISINKLSELMSYNPSQILNLNCGLIKEGYEGNLVLVDLDSAYYIDTNNFISKGKNNPFDGIKVYGEVKITVKRGRIIYDNR